jgi:hypothetical protein
MNDFFDNHDDRQPTSISLEQAQELDRNIRRTVELWRSMGKLDYPLNEDGKVARLEDARDMLKLVTNAMIDILMSEHVQMIMLLTDPDKYQFMSQLAVIAHRMACVDPECKINHPTLGLEEGAA